MRKELRMLEQKLYHLLSALEECRDLVEDISNIDVGNIETCISAAYIELLQDRVREAIARLYKQERR